MTIDKKIIQSWLCEHENKEYRTKSNKYNNTKQLKQTIF